MTNRELFLQMTPAQKIQEIDRWLSDPEWCKDKPLRVRVVHVRNGLLKHVIRYREAAPFTLWVLNIEMRLPCDSLWSIGSHHSDDLNPVAIFNYRLYMGQSRFKCQ